jgi:zinc transport system ATP-binding protein
MNASACVRLRDVSFIPEGQEVLKNISLELQKGQLTTLIGPNGAGKSTLLKILLGLLKPTSGTVHREGGLRIGYVPQKFTINPFLPLTVKDFLALFTKAKSPSSRNHVLEWVAAGHLYDHPFQKLSGGELQRVLLANALQNDPQLLVLDEPTQGLDIKGQKSFYELLHRLKSASPGLSILLASHDLYMVLQTSDTVICLQHHVCCMGAPHSVQEHPSYLKLFGESVHLGLVPYTHHHSHSHDGL